MEDKNTKGQAGPENLLEIKDDDFGTVYKFKSPNDVQMGVVDRFLRETSTNPGKGCRSLLVDCMVSPSFQEYSDTVLAKKRFHFVGLSSELAKAYGLEGNFTIKK